MNEENQVGAIVDAAKAAKEVLPQTTAEADGALSTLVGWFNNVVLYPVKKANITYRYKLECFQDDLREKATHIPEECMHSPNLMIAGPTLEALKYTFDEEMLRKMYVNLLASSMDSRKDDYVHPSYVEIIRQMNPFDATLFKSLCSSIGNTKAINPNIGICGTNQIYVDATPKWFIKSPYNQNVFQLSASLVRLSKLGIVELMYDRTAGTEEYDELKLSPQLTVILQHYQAKYPDKKLEIRATNSILYVNEYGKQFAKVCL